MKALLLDGLKGARSRRSFIKKGLAAGSATLGARLLADGLAVFGQGQEEKSGRVPRRDAAIIRFLAAAGILETGFCVQYNELCGNQDNEGPAGGWRGTYY